MTADPGAGMTFVADPKKPVGGHILAHASATRIMVHLTILSNVYHLYSLSQKF